MSSIKRPQGSNLVFCILPGLAAGFIVYLAIAVMGTGFFSNAAFFGGGAMAIVVSVAVIMIFFDAPEPISGTASPAETVSAPAAKASAAPAKAAAKAAAPAQSSADASKPALLSAPRAGGADDLKKISGVGPKLEEQLNAAGVYHYDQIASWSAAEVAWADENLTKFKGRISRDDWVGQAKALLNA